MKPAKYHQGRKDTRVRLYDSLPLRPTHYHRRVDKLLAPPPPPPTSEPPPPHRHKYRKLVRITAEGDRVVACNCGDHRLMEGPG